MTEKTKPDRQLYTVEFTDTYGGEANYCWVNRFTVRAASINQAITIAKKHRYCTPLPRHTLSLYDNMTARIDIKGAAVCAFIDWLDAGEWTADSHGEIIND